MSDWKELTLREAGISLIDCDHKTPLPTDKGLPYIAIPQLEDGCINFSDARLISEEDFKIWTRKANPQTHDVVLSRRCNPGESAYVADGMRFALGQNLVLLRSDGELVIKHFLRWLIKSPAWWSEVSKFINVGAVFNSLKCGEIINFTLPIPPIKQQESISKTLCCIDSKIDNLRRQNKTLEEIARSFFKHWFIDFEFPNPDGKPYKSSGGAMVRSDLGDIPEGWQVRKLGDVATNNSETHKFDNKNKIIFINTGDILDGKFLHENYMSVNTLPGQAKKRIAKDDILYSEIRPKNKHFAYINFERNLENYVVSTKFMVVRANDSILPRLLYLILKRQESIDEFNYIAESRSGTFPQITFEAVSHFEFPLPPIDIQKYLMLVFTNLMEKKEFNVIKIETLTKTRDALLPKLMSGQLRVKG